MRVLFFVGNNLRCENDDSVTSLISPIICHHHVVISYYICCRVLTPLHIDIAFDILCVDNASDDLAPVKTTT